MATNMTAANWKFKVNPWITMIPIMLVIVMFALDECSFLSRLICTAR